MKRITVGILALVAAVATAAEPQPPAGLVKNPRFLTATPDRKAPAHYALTGNVAWAYCGWGDEASDWGVALHSGRPNPPAQFESQPNPPAPFPKREGGEDSKEPL